MERMRERLKIVAMEGWEIHPLRFMTCLSQSVPQGEEGIGPLMHWCEVCMEPKGAVHKSLSTPRAKSTSPAMVVRKTPKRCKTDDNGGTGDPSRIETVSGSGL